MNFDFDADQYAIQDSVHNFLADQWSTAKLRALEDGDGFDPSLWQGLAEVGIPGMLVPEAHGGLGLSFVDLALVLEEFGRALVPGPLVETLLAADVLARFGTPRQQTALLPGIAEGTFRVVPAVTEADSSGDHGRPACHLTKAADGFVLNGRKILVPYAGTADRLLVSVRFDGSDQPGLVLVDPTSPGVTRRCHTLFDFASRADDVLFEAVPVAAADVLGGSPSAAALQRLLDAGAAASAMQLTGIAGKMLDLAVDYIGQRVQFGRPIGAFQALKHRCADMMVQVETSRTAAYYASWAMSFGTAEEAAQAASMAKAFCGDAARSVCNEAIQLHGGVGFAWELDLHLYLRRAKSLEYAFGDASVHRERVLTAALTARDSSDYI